MEKTTLRLAQHLSRILTLRKIKCAVAESCTGGKIGAAITHVAGSSQWFDRGFITYSNCAKEDMLNVPHQTLLRHGAVSEETACAMAHGALLNSRAQVTVAVTGVAGPAGGSDEKPVGTVWIAWAGDQQVTRVEQFFFSGDRQSIREQTVNVALQGLIQRCDPRLQEEKSHDGYFFALFPPLTLAKKLHNQTSSSLSARGAQPVPADKFHLTLVYLGPVSASFLHHALHAAAQQKMNGFHITLNKMGYWRHNKVNWLGAQETPKELLLLVKHLNHALVRCGFKPEKKKFIPHLTLARCSPSIKPPSIQPITWKVNDFCFVKSITGSTPRYEIIHRWPLRKPD